MESLECDVVTRNVKPKFRSDNNTAHLICHLRISHGWKSARNIRRMEAEREIERDRGRNTFIWSIVELLAP